MTGEQTWEAVEIGSAPAAFAGDSEIGDDTARCGDTLGIALPIVEMDEAEIKPGRGAPPPPGKRRKIGAVIARFGPRRVQEVDMPLRPAANAVHDLDEDRHVLGLDDMLVERRSVTQMVAHLDGL